MSWRCKEERNLITEVVGRGWVLEGRNKVGHLVVSWPPTNRRIPLPGDPGRRGLLNALALVRRVERMSVFT